MGILRVILAIAVVIAHSSDDFFGLEMTGGIVAVQMFFIISGFYMALILSEKYIGPESYRLFLSNRALKIFPIYWVMLILTTFASLTAYFIFGKYGSFSPYIEYSHAIPIEGMIFQFVSNIIILGQDVVMFIEGEIDTESLNFTWDFRSSELPFYKFLLLPQAWSLSLELMFYLMAPALVRQTNRVLCSLLLISLALRFVAYYFLDINHDPWSYRFFPFEIALFLLGILSYRIYKIVDKKQNWNFKYGGLLSIFFLAIIVFIEFFPMQIEVSKWILYFLFSCFFLPLLFKKTKSIKIDREIGELSYPIYIGHLLVINSISPFFNNEYKGEISILLSVILAYILVKYISKPLEKYRKKRFELNIR